MSNLSQSMFFSQPPSTLSLNWRYCYPTSMKYLVNANCVVDYLKGRPNAQELLDKLFHDGLAISINTYGEVYEGIYFGLNPKKTEVTAL